MSLPAHLQNAVDEIDAALFSGDAFIDPEARAWLREKLARFERGLKEFDDAPLPARVPKITEKEKEFLRLLTSGHWCVRDGTISKQVQSLIDRGYCRTEPERIGPLASPTGETAIHLTEAGATILSLK